MNLLQRRNAKRRLSYLLFFFTMAKLRFETLKLVHNKKHVRTNHAPTTPEELKVVFKEIKKKIACVMI